MNKKNKFLMLRLSIYLLGGLILIAIIILNIWETKEKQTSMNASQAKPGNFYTYIDTNYETARFNLLFPQEPSSPEIRIAKSLSAFLQEEKSGIYYPEALQEKLFKNNNSSFPNGSLLEFQGTVYFLEEGSLREISSPKVFDTLGYKWGQVKKINQEEFESFPKSEDDINLKNIQEAEKFPEDMLIKSEEDLYITGTKNFYPVLIKEKKIQEIWPDFTFAQAQKLNLQNSIRPQCFKLKEGNKITCKADLKEINQEYGNIYQLNINSDPLPSQVDTKLERSITWKEIKQNTKKLFLKQ